MTSSEAGPASLREVVEDLRETVPAPDGYPLVAALAVATWFVSSRWAFEWTSRPGVHDDLYLAVHPALLDSAPGIPWIFRQSSVVGLPLPPAFPWLTLDLLTVIATAYVGLHLVAVGARGHGASRETLPRAPGALTPTWPRLGVTAAVALQALVFAPLVEFGPRYVFAHVYAASADRLASAGVIQYTQYISPGRNPTYLVTVSDPVAVVLPYLPALLITYLGVVLTFAGISRALRRRAVAPIRDRLWRVPSSVGGLLG